MVRDDFYFVLGLTSIKPNTKQHLTSPDIINYRLKGLCQAIYYPFNPLSRNGDQDQFSPNDIHILSRDKVMRITEMITKEKML